MADKGKNTKESNRYYWVDQVDPELMNEFIRLFPDITITSKESRDSSHAVMCRPGPMLEGVGSEEVAVGRMYFDENSGSNKPSTAAVMHIHGGGRIMGTHHSGTVNLLCSRMVKLLNVPVLSAKHRLAPEHPFPAALDDLVAAYKWLVDYIKKENPSATNESIRIAITGESAGGGLGAELCQRLLDENADDYPLPVAQLLIYPMLDDRTSVHGLSDDDKSNLPPHLIWCHPSNLYAWTAYLGPKYKPGQDELPKYASASRRANLQGLPPTWIVVGDSDVFLPECQNFAQRMKDAGVPAECLEVKGAYHGFVTMSTGEEAPLRKVWQSFQDFASQYLTKEI